MKEGADLRKYFMLFESTQKYRRTPRQSYAATLRPLLNTASVKAASRDTDQLKKILIEQADFRNDATIQQFWEHRKTKTDTWQEELAELRKLAQRCSPSDNRETVREIFVIEQMTQQLPKIIQQFVRERKPTSPEQILEHILTYFWTKSLDEQAQVSKETFTAKKSGGAKQVISPSHGNLTSLSQQQSTIKDVQ